MNTPLRRGSAINTSRINGWLSRFTNYRSTVTRGAIELWMEQFNTDDRDIAARLLDSVLYISYEAIQSNYRSLLQGIDGWDIRANHREGQWYFVPYSSSVGESGDSMLHFFRMANSLNHRQFDSLFIHRSELTSKQLGPSDTVVLIDDFSGTGKQACAAWEQFFSEILVGSPRVILLLLAATNNAINRIRQGTDMEPHCFQILDNRDNLFHSSCRHYTNTEKAQILNYCNRADKKNPRGYGDCGLMIVFSHQCPNNSISILHAKNGKWSGLFPRF